MLYWQQLQVGFSVGEEGLRARLKRGFREGRNAVSFSSSVAEIPQQATSWEQELEQSAEGEMPSSCGHSSPRLPSSSTLARLSAPAEEG
ncbi:unnamed protein product, partial [Pylaiella littoralis]